MSTTMVAISLGRTSDATTTPSNSTTEDHTGGTTTSMMRLTNPCISAVAEVVVEGEVATSQWIETVSDKSQPSTTTRSRRDKIAEVVLCVAVVVVTVDSIKSTEPIDMAQAEELETTTMMTSTPTVSEEQLTKTEKTDMKTWDLHYRSSVAEVATVACGAVATCACVVGPETSIELITEGSKDCVEREACVAVLPCEATTLGPSTTTPAKTTLTWSSPLSMPAEAQGALVEISGEAEAEVLLIANLRRETTAQTVTSESVCFEEPHP